MKKNILKTILTASIVLMAMGTKVVSASEFSFAVEPERAKTQVNKEVTYFDISVKPKEKQTLKVKLRNDTEKDVTVSSVVNATTTNLNGVVEYSPNKIKKDDTLKYDIKDLIELPDEVKIPKQSEKILELKVTPPSESFDGIISGGITFKDKAKPKENDNSGSGLSIKNEFSYVVAIVLHSKDTEVKRDLKLLDVYPDQVNVRNTIRLKFQNPQPVFLNNLRFKAEITKKDDSEIIYQTEKKDQQMAPNSNYSSPISLEGQKLEPGHYTAHVEALAVKNKEGKFPSEEKGENGKVLRYDYKWNFDKDFEITSDVADKLNAKDVTIKKSLSIWWIILIIIFLLLVLLIIAYLIKKHLDKKRKEELEERKRLEDLLNDAE